MGIINARRGSSSGHEYDSPHAKMEKVSIAVSQLHILNASRLSSQLLFLLAERKERSRFATSFVPNEVKEAPCVSRNCEEEETWQRGERKRESERSPSATTQLPDFPVAITDILNGEDGLGG